IKSSWDVISEYVTATKSNNFLNENRKSQNKYWLLQTINDKLQSNFFGSEKIKKELEKQYDLLDNKKTTPFAAA
ncbi:MAG TPA: methylmalonyl Co-A mutase-associated GTPase MeaB, partial [Flavobacteriaceae bacterium]|nr:methylmalonyl Co-A mutase-associated GTPase MeaB [Flavobacteriaceae bacterium]